MLVVSRLQRPRQLRGSGVCKAWRGAVQQALREVPQLAVASATTESQTRLTRDMI